jgi:CRP-like cAMP-binding protein
MMFQTLLQNINNIITLTREEEEHLKTFFISKKILKKQFIVQQDDPSKYLIYVVKGALKSFTVNEDGNTNVMQFAIEDWWMAENNSFFTGEPSMYSMDAVEDSQLLLLTHENYERMLADIPKMEKYWRSILEKRIIAMQRRITIMLTYSIEKKYTRFMEIYPNLNNRFPQHLIASYLGISPETLSRLRKSINSKK